MRSRLVYPSFVLLLGIAIGVLVTRHGSGDVDFHPSVRQSVAAETPERTIGHARLLFVGDLFFDRYIRIKQRQFGEDHPLSCASDLLKSVDVVVGNLEGPITEDGSISEGSAIGSPENFSFTFPTSTAHLLARHNIGIVDLGNNHIGNKGSAGLLSTRQSLDTTGVSYFGGMLGDEPILREAVGSVPLSLVSYNAFLGTSSEAVATAVARERREGRIVIVYAHWGEEYSTSTKTMREDAERFARAGANLVVGAHPHIVIPKEEVLGVPVYYSLGNFLFDQYWNDAVRHGLALEVRIDGDRLAFLTHETELMRDGRVCAK